MSFPEITLVSENTAQNTQETQNTFTEQCDPAWCNPFCNPIQPCSPEQSCGPMANCQPEFGTCEPRAACSPDMHCVPALGGNPCLPDVCSPNAFPF